MIPYLPLGRITALHSEAIHAAAARVIDSGWYLLGREVSAFEQSWAGYVGTEHCVATANGLDALTLILQAYKELGRLREGDEVIVPANTYIATILSITANRLTPVLVEPDPATFQIDGNRIEQALTPRTRAIMIVHLYGHPAYTPAIADICRRHGLLLIEDNAQAHGAVVAQASTTQEQYKHEALSATERDVVSVPQVSHTGCLGDAAAHSFYPGKNLGALGDAGAVTTSDADLAAMVRALANYGSARKYVFDHIGRNSRMDELQAAVLSAKLPFLDADNARRRAIALRYIKEITNPAVSLPSLDYARQSVFHIFPLIAPGRNALQAWLTEQGVGTMIHYPIPPHRQACYPNWHNLCLPVTELIHRQELSLPCHPAMTDDEVAVVIKAVSDWRE